MLRAHRSLCLALISLALPARAQQPKVCGNQPALGDFVIERCPIMRDDGVAPDERAGDGVFTLARRIEPTPRLRYKILPLGAYGPTEIRQVGECGPGGERENPSGDILVPGPAAPGEVVFYYQSRRPSDESYAMPPSGRSGGDSLMTTSPAGVGWVAVGDFQERPFDPREGALPLLPQGEGALAGETTLTSFLPAGWRWKVLEGKGSYEGARKFGPDGWSVTPCDSDNVRVGAGLSPGARVRLVFHAQKGLLQTLVLREGGARHDASAPDDQAAPAPPDGGADPDASMTPVYPGIRCSAGPAQGGGGEASAAVLLFLGIIVGKQPRRRERHDGMATIDLIDVPS